MGGLFANLMGAGFTYQVSSPVRLQNTIIAAKSCRGITLSWWFSFPSASLTCPPTPTPARILAGIGTCTIPWPSFIRLRLCLPDWLDWYFFNGQQSLHRKLHVSCINTHPTTRRVSYELHEHEHEHEHAVTVLERRCTVMVCGSGNLSCNIL